MKMKVAWFIWRERKARIFKENTLHYNIWLRKLNFDLSDKKFGCFVDYGFRKRTGKKLL